MVSAGVIRMVTLGTLLAAMLGCSRQPEFQRVAQPHRTNERTLVLVVLNVQSSYRNKTEKPATDVCDTVQWWITPDNTWRIRTFAMDHDIHIHEIRSPVDPSFAINNTKKHYGDVIGSVNLLRFPNFADEQSVREVLGKTGLAPNLEVARGGFAFWNPDNAKYRTQSRPEEDDTE